MLKKTFAALALGTALLCAGQAMAAEYKIDKEGQHAFVDFKISHLGYSFITGTFKDWDGSFSWDPAKPEASKIDVTLKTASVDTNHAERDKHIKSKDFLDVGKYATATFKSTKVTPTGKNAEGQLTADVAGDLTLTGVTKPVVIKATFIGEGKDPWGGYRAGFEGKLDINRKDFAPKSMDLGPLSEKVELYFVFEGVQQK
ncbi:MAG: YceI family protein [Paucimonas sp.]|jgi:polyisoprenoid-binding protein YceI|uniref:YceI family protein n=1 Tax=Pantoea sp. Cy-639 TaxID=2608360 RepID=UPI00141FCCFD|nr:YceI family protein [Pantoea sp. Cy-639]MDR2308694.1 YceI family protein [Paucimonas sp.]NIF17645.1 YceI family protein [Pantoea sp. Cy-639]